MKKWEHLWPNISTIVRPLNDVQNASLRTLSMFQAGDLRKKIRRVQQKQQYQITRALLQISSHLAPQIVAQWAEPKLLTPRKVYKTTVEDQIFLDRARSDEIFVKGHRIRTWSWGEGPTVLLLHGWEGRGIQLRAFISPLLDRGFSVSTLDQMAHGESEGEKTTVIDYAATLNQLTEANGKFHAVIGHSMGAAAAALAHRSRPLADQFVFIAAAVEPIEGLQFFANEMGFGQDALKLFIQSLEERFQLKTADLSMLLTDWTERSVMVIHDRKDTQVPWQQAAALAARATNAKLELTEGLGHYRILKSRDVIAKAIGFICP